MTLGTALCSRFGRTIRPSISAAKATSCTSTNVPPGRHTHGNIERVTLPARMTYGGAVNARHRKTPAHPTRSHIDGTGTFSRRLRPRSGCPAIAPDHRTPHGALSR